MVVGTGLMDLVPTLVVQSCCVYADAAAPRLTSASTDREMSEDRMFRILFLARVAGLRTTS